MAENKFSVSGDQYREIDRKLREIKRQLDQKGGSPLDPVTVSRKLQEIIEHRMSDEYLVFVDYEMPRDRSRLEEEFSATDHGKLGWGTEGVSDCFYESGYEWRYHGLAKERKPGAKLFRVTQCGDDEMEKLGYRAANYLELYAFAKNHPDVQRQFWIKAYGSSVTKDGTFKYAVVGCKNGCRVLWISGENSIEERVLYVRK